MTKETMFKIRLSKLLIEFGATLSYSHDDDGIILINHRTEMEFNIIRVNHE